MAQDPLRYFRLEAREILDQCAGALLALERGANDGQVRLLLRLAHTLKGAARVVRQLGIAERAHTLEDILLPWRDAAAVSRASLEGAKHELEAIEGFVDALPAAVPIGPPGPQSAVAEETVRTLRAQVSDMDALLESVDEASALLGGLRLAVGSLDAARLRAGQLAGHAAPEASAGPASLYVRAGELERNIAGTQHQLSAAVDLIDREFAELRIAAARLRLAGTGGLMNVLERTARDAAQALSREIVFAGTASDMRVDADILSGVQDALVQVVRNAVAHGIEPAAARVAAGKPRAGRIAVRISRQGGRIVFVCEDDGAGIDLAGVRQVALRGGLPPAEVNALGAEELVRLLLAGGISTSASVSGIAGRGIGLDVVREAAARVDGATTLTTEAGRGTRFTLSVPMSMAAVAALHVVLAATTAAVPLDGVREARRLQAAEIARGGDGMTVEHDRQLIPLLWLPSAFGGVPLAPDQGATVLIVAGDGGAMAAVGVDGVVGTQEIVVRPLPQLVPASAFVSGAALDALGDPLPVLDVDGLIAAARAPDPTQPARQPERRRILVIDDSLTTRMLEQSILESAGYEVDLADSAEAGFVAARHRPPALFLVDVEMPGMDGYSFIERAAADAAFQTIPAILVTSRSSPADRQRGFAAGARGCIAKGEFDQNELLAMIRGLIGP